MLLGFMMNPEFSAPIDAVSLQKKLQRCIPEFTPELLQVFTRSLIFFPPAFTTMHKEHLVHSECLQASGWKNLNPLLIELARTHGIMQVMYCTLRFLFHLVSTLSLRFIYLGAFVI
jgi:hypothetical protein